jgi:virulence-associated protein VapD
MSEEELIELREDMRTEMLQDQRHEELMKSSYEYVLKSLGDEFEAIREAYKNITTVFEKYGWENVSQDDILSEIKEIL